MKFYYFLLFVLLFSFVLAQDSHDHVSDDLVGLDLFCEDVTETCNDVECFVTCPSGTVVTGGGFSNDDSDSSHVDDLGPLSFVPGHSGEEGWYAYAYNSNPTTVYAVCCSVGSNVSQCSDGIDNDNDGTIDFLNETVRYGDVTKVYPSSISARQYISPGTVFLTNGDFSEGDVLNAVDIVGRVSPVGYHGPYTGNCVDGSGDNVVNGRILTRFSLAQLRFYDVSHNPLGDEIQLNEFLDVTVPSGAVTLEGYFHDSYHADNIGFCTFNLEVISNVTLPNECNDGIDNDNDGTADLGVSSLSVSREGVYFNGLHAPVEHVCDTSTGCGTPPVTVFWDTDFNAGDLLTVNNIIGEFHYDGTRYDCSGTSTHPLGFLPKIAFYSSTDTLISEVDLRSVSDVVIPIGTKNIYAYLREPEAYKMFYYDNHFMSDEVGCIFDSIIRQDVTFEADSACVSALDSNENYTNDLSCLSAAQGFEGCVEGFADCDGDPGNGCEADLTSDFTCGSCTNACLVTESCSAGSCENNGYNQWYDLIGKNISSASIGSYVKMFSPWVGQGNYTVYDLNDDLLLNTDLSYFQLSNEFENIVFNVSTASINALSADLTVLPPSVNVPMTITIMNPTCGSHYMKDSVEIIRINLSDPDDIISGNVTIDGILVTEFTNLDGPIFEYNHTFGTAGNIPIVVSATNTNYERYREVVNVIVIDPLLDDVYVASCIDEPKNFERFTSSSVRFRADSTKALNYTVADGIELIPIDDLEFTWTFFHRGSQTFTCTNLGRESCFAAGTTTMYDFFKEFSTVEENSAVLSVSII